MQQSLLNGGLGLIMMPDFSEVDRLMKRVLVGKNGNEIDAGVYLRI